MSWTGFLVDPAHELVLVLKVKIGVDKERVSNLDSILFPGSKFSHPELLFLGRKIQLGLTGQLFEDVDPLGLVRHQPMLDALDDIFRSAFDPEKFPFLGLALDQIIGVVLRVPQTILGHEFALLPVPFPEHV